MPNEMPGSFEEARTLMLAGSVIDVHLRRITGGPIQDASEVASAEVVHVVVNAMLTAGLEALRAARQPVA